MSEYETNLEKCNPDDCIILVSYNEKSVHRKIVVVEFASIFLAFVCFILTSCKFFKYQ